MVGWINVKMVIKATMSLLTPLTPLSLGLGTTVASGSPI